MRSSDLIDTRLLRRLTLSAAGLLVLGVITGLFAAAQPALVWLAAIVVLLALAPLVVLLLQLAATHRAFVTLEDNAVAGGAGSAVAELLASENVLLPQLQIGIPDRFIEHGSRDDCLMAAGLDATNLHAAIKLWWGLQQGSRARSSGIA